MITILLLMGAGLSAGFGIFIQYVAGQDGLIVGISIALYVFAALFLLLAVWNILETVARHRARHIKRQRIKAPKRRRRK